MRDWRGCGNEGGQGLSSRPRHVLVTGGSRGIGLAIAQLFAKNEYRCTLISRSERDLKDAVASLEPLPAPAPPAPQKQQQETEEEEEEEEEEEAFKSPTSSNTHNTQYQHGYIAGSIASGTRFWTSDASLPFCAHLPKPDRKQHATHASRIDVMVNCAGITQTKLFKAMDEAAMENIINTNLTALMLGTKFLLRNGYLGGGGDRRQGEDGGGGGGGGEDFSPVIINVASLLGLQGGYGAVAYAASKAGVLGFTRALATEYASHRVRVNAIVPGYVATDMTKNLQSDHLNKRIPLGRFGTPAEIAHAALFLAENQYAHNCLVNLDGGLSAV
ncbi:uncharacterized protein SETTUDRAFT_157050 [Exserohilum turcica Et28A]|uniref:Uncharacterized protein n=1 Tax=Exserohilum turcicum (strain 28A) TaxID=671987 RepID=R0I9S4_EXST2|nr:uncharacterized protein SETTUDRAFT_157050 [Exserohilum turcica Et28A]EOA82210.1 hypothetical protein SETTUDRAFT_157050 [Exserohilum turcica Et28A]